MFSISSVQVLRVEEDIFFSSWFLPTPSRPPPVLHPSSFPSSTMSYRKEMEKYRDVDEDELLQKLSEEELRRLEDELEELDPDVRTYHRLHHI